VSSSPTGLTLEIFCQDGESTPHGRRQQATPHTFDSKVEALVRGELVIGLGRPVEAEEPSCVQTRRTHWVVVGTPSRIRSLTVIAIMSPGSPPWKDPGWYSAAAVARSQSAAERPKAKVRSYPI
jgi:hypothetical protein